MSQHSGRNRKCKKNIISVSKLTLWKTFSHSEKMSWPQCVRKMVAFPLSECLNSNSSGKRLEEPSTSDYRIFSWWHLRNKIIKNKQFYLNSSLNAKISYVTGTRKYWFIYTCSVAWMQQQRSMTLRMRVWTTPHFILLAWKSVAWRSNLIRSDDVIYMLDIGENGGLGVRNWALIQRIFSLIPSQICVQIFLSTDWNLHHWQSWNFVNVKNISSAPSLCSSAPTLHCRSPLPNLIPIITPITEGTVTTTSLQALCWMWEGEKGLKMGFLLPNLYVVSHSEHWQ
jgi:hypothetical protein